MSEVTRIASFEFAINQKHKKLLGFCEELLSFMAPVTSLIGCGGRI
jgi:hypothetical protein